MGRRSAIPVVGLKGNTMNLRLELGDLPARELIEALATRMYEPPLSEAHERLPEVVSGLRAVLLVLDFDTEVNMQGMLGFLENSTGLALTDTIQAFGRIGALETSEILRRVEAILESHGVTPARLRSDFAGATAYQITTFRELHGDLGSLPEEVEREAERLYVYAEPGCGENVWALVAAFVEANREEVLAEIERLDDA